MRKMLLSCLGMLGLTAQGMAQEYTQESLETIRGKIERQDGILLDVREQSEWDEGYIRQARLIATSTLRDESQREMALDGLLKTKPIFCHCKKGGRAMMVSRLLQELGYDMRPMRQAYEQIVAAGFEEIKPSANRENNSP